MDTYITGAVIKRLRENKNLTQSDLAEVIGVSSKAVSKWETVEVRVLERMCLPAEMPGNKRKAALP